MLWLEHVIDWGGNRYGNEKTETKQEKDAFCVGMPCSWMAHSTDHKHRQSFIWEARPKGLAGWVSLDLTHCAAKRRR